MINAHEVVPDCKHVNCTHLLYTGSCLSECLKRYKSELGVNTEARWTHRGAYNDFIWAECSNCGFRVENYKAVKTGRSDTDYVEAKYKFCPMCGKSMGV
jgi:ribosomal protein L33